MMSISNKSNWYAMSDTAIVEELGKQLKKMRLKANMTQQDLADKCGLFRSTISEIENGRIGSMLSIIQILRGLNELELLQTFIVPEVISPLMVAEQQAKYRKRATSKKNTKPDSEW